MGRTILIVDDNDAYRGMLRTVLTERGYVVSVVRNGAEGLAAVAADPAIEAVLVDVDMPGMDGFEFCRQLRAEGPPDRRDLPVWIMTGALQLGLARRGTAVGAVLVLRKPFDVDDACAQLERTLSARAKPAHDSPPA